ncbi:MAG: ABC transporter permease [Methylotenera sp.]|nr:ABC transporter permease [Oligoflexia bacterium]
MKALTGFAILVIAFLWSPLMWVAYRGASVEAFARLMTREDILSAATQSFGLAFVAATLATFFGMITAFALPGMPRFKGWLIETGLIFPMVLPEIAMGLSFLVWYIFLGTPFGWGTLVASHVAFCFSFATLAMKARVETLDRGLIDAAHDLGASPAQVFRHAIFPQIAPGLLASWVTCFSLSLDDFFISFFVKGLSQMTLPIQLYSMMKVRIGPEIYALSLILFCFSLLAVLVTQLWLKSKLKSANALPSLTQA